LHQRWIFAAVLPAVLVLALLLPSRCTRADAVDHPKVLYIQTVRYKTEISQGQIRELLQSLQNTLSRISEVKSIRVGRIVDEPRAYDYAIAMEFDSLDDLHSYANSPIHRQWVQTHNPGPLTDSHMTLTIQTGLDH
jgi:hypothetical protein